MVVANDKIIYTIQTLLEDIQQNLYNRALKRRNSMLYKSSNYEEFKNLAETKPGFIEVNFCGEIDCEDQIKKETGLKSRVE